MNRQTYLESIQHALHSLMDEDDRVILLGEDILDPYGGAFKVTKGLSSKHPKRVICTPISEGAIVGVGTGLALRGYRPVVEIMFGDFLTLATDQIVNSATKFPLMYKGNVTVPLVVRTPMGAGRGYGPTHSQSIEKMFLGVPGLKVVSPTIVHNPGKILKNCILKEKEVVLFVEYKNLYGKHLEKSDSDLYIDYWESNSEFPVAIVKNFSSGKYDAIVISYGSAAEKVLNVMRDLIEEEIRILSIFPSHINIPISSDLISSFFVDSAPIFVVEESTAMFNWGSEVSSNIYDRFVGNIKLPITRVSADNDIIPAAKELEEAVILTEEKIKNSIFLKLS